MDTSTQMETPVTLVARKNKLSIIGFILMLAGPLILFLAGLITESVGYLPAVAANIISLVCMILPGNGAVISIMTLVKWKKTGRLGRALAIITVVMCNPFFYFYYFFICALSSRALAGLSWM